MPLRTAILVLAGLILSFANGSLVKRVPAETSRDRVLECMDSSSRRTAEIGIELGEVPNKDIVLCCNYTKIISDCLADPFEPTSGSSELLDFIRAYFLQRSLLEGKLNICPQQNLDKLKDLVTESDIMRKEGLTSIENDTPGACAGKIHKKCLLETEHDWEKDLDQFSLFLVLIGCEEIGAGSCSDDEMMQHFSETNKKFKELIMKNNAELAIKMQEIKN